METATGNFTRAKIDQWYNQIRSVNSLTEADCYDLKEHLLDIMDELTASGLNEDDAFDVATVRLGKNTELEEEFAWVNSDNILIRKVVLVFSGIMFFFLIYFFMMVSSRTIFFSCHKIIKNPVQFYWYILTYIVAWHILIVILTTLIYFRGHKFYSYIKTLNIKPSFILLLTVFVFILAVLDLEIHQIIRHHVPLRYLKFSNYFNTFGYSGYSFPFLLGFCYLAFLRKRKKNDINIVNLEPDNSALEGKIKLKYSKELEELKNNGLGYEEAMVLVSRHNGIVLNNENKKTIEQKTINSVSIALSGILIYLFLYYLLNATINILFTVLQKFNDDPAKNFRWIVWYIATYDLIIIFFTTSVYIKDHNLLNELKKLSVKAINLFWIFISTIFIAIVDRYMMISARATLKGIFELKEILLKITQYGDLCFSFVLLICFLILFNKYYRENMKIC